MKYPENVELSPEEKWKFAADFWIRTYLSALKAIGEVIGWDKLNEILLRNARESGWEDLDKILDKLDIRERDAIAWEKWDLYLGLNGFPEIGDEVLESSPEKARVCGTKRCILYDIAKELDLDKKLDLFNICKESSTNVARKINPDFEYKVLAGRCAGDEYCESSCTLR